MDPAPHGRGGDARGPAGDHASRPDRPHRHTPAEVVGGQSARISFNWPPGAVPPLPVLPGGVAVERTRGGVVLRTGDLQLTVSALLVWANGHDLRLHNLNARSASLQEAFLAVAGSGGDQSDQEWVA